MGAIKKYVPKELLKFRADQSFESKARVLRRMSDRDLLANVVEQTTEGNRGVFGTMLGVDRRMIRSYLSVTHRPPWFLLLLLRALASGALDPEELRILAMKVDPPPKSRPRKRQSRPRASSPRKKRRKS